MHASAHLNSVMLLWVHFAGDFTLRHVNKLRDSCRPVHVHEVVQERRVYAHCPLAGKLPL